MMKKELVIIGGGPAGLAAAIAAKEAGIIPESRHKNYCIMYEEAKQIKEWELDK